MNVVLHPPCPLLLLLRNHRRLFFVEEKLPRSVIIYNFNHPKAQPETALAVDKAAAVATYDYTLRISATGCCSAIASFAKFNGVKDALF